MKITCFELCRHLLLKQTYSIIIFFLTCPYHKGSNVKAKRQGVINSNCTKSRSQGKFCYSRQIWGKFLTTNSLKKTLFLILTSLIISSLHVKLKSVSCPYFKHKIKKRSQNIRAHFFLNRCRFGWTSIGLQHCRS